MHSFFKNFSHFLELSSFYGFFVLYNNRCNCIWLRTDRKLLMASYSNFPFLLFLKYFPYSHFPTPSSHTLLYSTFHPFSFYSRLLPLSLHFLTFLSHYHLLSTSLLSLSTSPLLCSLHSPTSSQFPSISPFPYFSFPFTFTVPLPPVFSSTSPPFPSLHTLLFPPFHTFLLRPYYPSLILSTTFPSYHPSNFPSFHFNSREKSTMDG